MTNKELQDILKTFPDDLEFAKFRRVSDARCVYEDYDVCDVEVRVGKDLHWWSSENRYDVKDGLFLTIKWKNK